MPIDQKIIDLYDDFTHSRLERRVFLERLAMLTGSVAAAMTILPLLGPNYAHGAITQPDDNRLETKRVTFKGFTGEVKAYQAKPKGAGRLPVVIVIHENRGSNPHIDDVTRRMALEGFLAVAPDSLSSVGGTPADQDLARDLFEKLDKDLARQDHVALVKILKSSPEGNGKVGAMGFCAGGTAVNQLAIHSPELDAAVPYYGRVPDVADVPKIKAPILAHYGEKDPNVNNGIPGFEEALKQANKKYTLHIYEGAQHSFNSDVSLDRYHKEAAELAWKRTVAFFKENLTGG